MAQFQVAVACRYCVGDPQCKIPIPVRNRPVGAALALLVFTGIAKQAYRNTGAFNRIQGRTMTGAASGGVQFKYFTTDFVLLCMDICL